MIPEFRDTQLDEATISEIIRTWPKTRRTLGAGWIGYASADQELQARWIPLAEAILGRDFESEPIDDSTKESWTIGMRGNKYPAVIAASAKLATVKTVRWGKRDIKAGRLLSRKPKAQSHVIENNAS